MRIARRLWLLLALGLVACDAAPPPLAPPHLTVADAAHDFGQLRQGTPIEHVFELVNDGGAPLTLIDLRVACDCAVTLDGPRDLPAGGRAALRLRCETADAAGPLRRTVTVSSNDPAQRALVLEVTGTVVLEAAAEPARVYLGEVPPGTDGARRVALHAGNDGVRFVSVTGGAPQLRARLGDADGRRALIIDTARAAPPGPFQTTLRVHTTSAVRPLIEVPVAGTIAAPPAGEDAR